MSIQIIKTITPVKWKQIDGFPEYYISSNGLVKKGSSLCKLHTKLKGYLYAQLRNINPDAKHHFARLDIHFLVWTHFGGSKPDKNNHIHHKDQNKQNNNIENLVILSAKEHKILHDKIRNAA